MAKKVKAVAKMRGEEGERRGNGSQTFSIRSGAELLTTNDLLGV
jgi:hypothetical protein